MRFLIFSRLGRDLQTPEKGEANPTYLYCAVGTRKNKKNKSKSGLNVSSQGLSFLNSKTEDGLSALHLAASEGYK